jgi:hypothetical protein
LNPDTHLTQTLTLTRRRSGLRRRASSEEPAKRYRASRKKPSTPPATLLLTSDEARRQAQAEKLTLLGADNKSGYFNVHLGTTSFFF